MKGLRQILLGVLLLLAQSGALIHALEHLRPDAHTPVSHVCALCITAQGLDVPLALHPASVTISVVGVVPMADVIVHVFAASGVSPRARAPPIA